MSHVARKNKFMSNMVPLAFQMCLFEALVVTSSFLVGIPTILLFPSIFSHPWHFPSLFLLLIKLYIILKPKLPIDLKFY
jgi:hypothetical protein